MVTMDDPGDIASGVDYSAPPSELRVSASVAARSLGKQWSDIRDMIEDGEISVVGRGRARMVLPSEVRAAFERRSRRVTPSTLRTRAGYPEVRRSKERSGVLGTDFRTRQRTRQQTRDRVTLDLPGDEIRPEDVDESWLSLDDDDPEGEWIDLDAVFLDSLRDPELGSAKGIIFAGDIEAVIHENDDELDAE
jgi:hypothetical protein